MIRALINLSDEPAPAKVPGLPHLDLTDQFFFRRGLEVRARSPQEELDSKAKGLQRQSHFQCIRPDPSGPQPGKGTSKVLKAHLELVRHVAPGHVCSGDGVRECVALVDRHHVADAVPRVQHHPSRPPRRVETQDRLWSVGDG